MNAQTEVRARRGELIVVPTTRSYMSLRDGHRAWTVYLVQRVTSVRRDGTAQARESLIDGTPYRGVVYGQMVAKGIDVERASRAIVERGSDEFGTLEEARDFLRPFRAAANS